MWVLCGSSGLSLVVYFDPFIVVITSVTPNLSAAKCHRKKKLDYEESRINSDINTCCNASKLGILSDFYSPTQNYHPLLL